MLIENELRNPNGSGKPLANQLSADAEVFARQMLDKYGQELSYDAIAFCISSAVITYCGFAIALDKV